MWILCRKGEQANGQMGQQASGKKGMTSVQRAVDGTT